MKYLDDFRNEEICRALVERIRRTVTTPRTIMEVCGGQTHGLLSHGIDQELAGTVELIHGPGCPVCVTAAEQIDFAVEIARQPGVVMTTFGDMVRVPGGRECLRDAKSTGADVRIVYSPVDAVALARREPDRQVVFFAVGFETTAPATAIAVRQAAALQLRNFSVILSHVRVLPAMEVIVQEPGRLDGFLAAGHVSAIIGYRCFDRLAAEHRKPVVVTGFEPADLLRGILGCVEQLERGEAVVENRYERCVRAEGNDSAMRMLAETFEVCDQVWRGMGAVPAGGFRLRDEFAPFDTRRRFAIEVPPVPSANRCRAGEVLTGRIKPPACEYFARECHPEQPLGAPMVSSEGACAAYFRHLRRAT